MQHTLRSGPAFADWTWSSKGSRGRKALLDEVRLHLLDRLEPTREHRPMYLDDDLACIRELNAVHARHAYPVEYHRLQSRPDVAPTVFVKKPLDAGRLAGPEERQLQVVRLRRRDSPTPGQVPRGTFPSWARR